MSGNETTKGERLDAVNLAIHNARALVDLIAMSPQPKSTTAAAWVIVGLLNDAEQHLDALAAALDSVNRPREAKA